MILNYTQISRFIGWLYVFLWDFSFYPNTYEILKLKRLIINCCLLFKKKSSGEGVKIDFVILNITGYIALSIYSTAGYFNHNLQIGTVNFEDLFFAYHSLVLSLL